MQKAFNVLVALIGLAVLILALAFVLSLGQDEAESEVAESETSEQIVREEILDALGTTITLRHTCEGEVRRSTELGKLFYCIGDNELVMTDVEGNERSLVEMTSTSLNDAPILDEVDAIGLGEQSKLLFAFAAINCRLLEESCGAGQPHHYINHLYDPSQGSPLASLSNYPKYGTLVWNWLGTKALVPVEQVGGAGCDDGSLVGYDLLADEVVALTDEIGCEFFQGEAKDVTGDEVRAEWGPAYWSGKDEYTTVLLSQDGTWKEITGTF
ncbi:MAG: hypothetical protein AAB413_04485 [Patescibacteria group bacterium]